MKMSHEPCPPPARRTLRPRPPRLACGRRGGRAALLRISLAAALGAGAALALSCGSSGKGLIPTANAGPLQGDFQAVAQAAETGDTKCGPTEAAIAKTEHDFRALPASIDSGLRARLGEGVSKLREDALKLCAQALPGVTVTSSSPRTTPTQTTTTPTVTQTTPTSTTPTITTPTTSGPGGGTPAPGETPGGEPSEEAGGSGGAGAVQEAGK
jgi:hypothetical protein